MIFEFRFPDVGEGITEGELVEWLVKEGDRVTQDQPLAKVETDKALIDIPAPQPGVVLKLHIAKGAVIKVGQVLVTLGQPGDVVASGTKFDSAGVVGSLEVSEKILPLPVQREVAVIRKSSIKVLPAVRQLATDLGVDIAAVIPSGNLGQITKNDVMVAAKKKSEPISEVKVQEPPSVKVQMKFDFYGPIDHVPVKGVRKATLKKMEDSWHNTVPVTHMDEVDITKLVELRNAEKEKAEKLGVKLTFLPFVIKAVVESLKEHPMLNCSLEDDDIVVKKYYNFGVAVDTADGLLVPVIKGVDQKNILELSKEIMVVAQKAKDRSLDRADLQGGSFTLTNVGSLGGVFATPIINYPECAILGLGKVQERPMFVGAKVEKRFMLPLFVTFDHRLVDGAEAARFMNKVKESLQDPEWLLLEL
ncbi:MAG TPA: dihydrolipoamide acetyltransferase family protein [Candidatus Nanoarchaeia archaeon]|nr:dihydrolipoamide acetyltransferase family protein [Candidatus Nanoarchaeia archaeon]